MGRRSAKGERLGEAAEDTGPRITPNHGSWRDCSETDSRGRGGSMSGQARGQQEGD